MMTRVSDTDLWRHPQYYPHLHQLVILIILIQQHQLVISHHYDPHPHYQTLPSPSSIR